MNKEEIEAIEHFKKYDNKLVYEINDKDKRYAKTLLNLIDKLQEENKNYKELILAIKGKLNNIQFEVEQAWRKIEKLESKYE